jgi:uncharacterized protein
VEISGDYLFDAPQNVVWDALQDPNVLGAVMPGGKGFEQTGENQYKGVLEIKVGPVQGTFQGEIMLSDVRPPEHYKIAVDGKGAPGFVKARGQLDLEARDSQTHMAYSGQAQVGGRIASVGQRLIDSAARSIIRQSLELLNEYLKTQVAHQPALVSTSAMPEAATAAPTHTVSASASVTYKPPSQMSLALKVARDVLGDLVPPKYQPWLVAAIIVIVIVVLLIARQ